VKQHGSNVLVRRNTSQVRPSATKNDEFSNCCILDFVPESESLTNVEEEPPISNPIQGQVEVHEQPPSQN
jgi:hypothetical protein